VVADDRQRLTRGCPPPAPEGGETALSLCGLGPPGEVSIASPETRRALMQLLSEAEMT
jgi:hypothetical protein